MFLVDDVLLKALDFLTDSLVEGRRARRQTVSHARKAMRKLAASLSETVAYLEGGLHNLERSVGDKKKFSKSLSDLVDQERLQRNCSESGVCEDLRVAQDELQQLPKAIRLRGGKKSINKLIMQIDGYEREFVKAIREFLSKSREFDLTSPHKYEAYDHKHVLGSLKERIEKLKKMADKNDKVSDSLRQKTA